MMLEQLQNKMVLLYEWFPLEGSTYEGKYVMIKRLHKYPDQIEPKTPFLTLLTPDFSKYIEFDELLGKWVLKETRT